MTIEELQKAYEEGTWLARRRYGGGASLVRISQALEASWERTLFATDTDGEECRVSFPELRIATANDMLKYGE